MHAYPMYFKLKIHSSTPFVTIFIFHFPFLFVLFSNVVELQAIKIGLMLAQQCNAKCIQIHILSMISTVFTGNNRWRGRIKVLIQKIRKALKQLVWCLFTGRLTVLQTVWQSMEALLESCSKIILLTVLIFLVLIGLQLVVYDDWLNNHFLSDKTASFSRVVNVSNVGVPTNNDVIY